MIELPRQISVKLTRCENRYAMPVAYYPDYEKNKLFIYMASECVPYIPEDLTMNGCEFTLADHKKAFKMILNQYKKYDVSKNTELQNWIFQTNRPFKAFDIFDNEDVTISLRGAYSISPDDRFACEYINFSDDFLHEILRQNDDDVSWYPKEGKEKYIEWHRKMIELKAWITYIQEVDT